MSENENNDDPKIPKSLHNDIVSYVIFCNVTKRQVDLFWIDYKGKLVRYACIPPGKATAMDTYVSHPWVVKDAITGKGLTLDRQGIYYPTPWNGDRSRKNVFIDIPVFTLKERSLEVVHRSLPYSVVTAANLPRTLLDELKTYIRPVGYDRNYKHFDHMHFFAAPPYHGIQDLVGDDDDEGDDPDDDDDDSSSNE